MADGSARDGSASNQSNFTLSITKALGDQLAAALDALVPAPLTPEALENVDTRAGVYQLYRVDEPSDGTESGFVYVGKADRSLRVRINKHLTKVSGRQNISLDEMFFTCLYVDEDFSALAPEKLLIKQYKDRGAIPWNTNGFGNNDPGKHRDGTIVSAKHFDAKFPVDLHRVISELPVGPVRLSRVLTKLSKDAPYTFRYEKKKTDGAYGIDVTLPRSEMTVAELLTFIASVLPATWQIAVFPGRVVMYPNAGHDYPSASRYYRGTEVLDVEPELDDTDVPDAENEDGGVDE